MRRELIPIAFVMFVNVLGFTILFPVLPFVVEQYGGGAFVYGLLLAAYSLFQFIGAPLLGSLSDVYGRKPLLILSHTGTLLSWVVFASAYIMPQINIGLVSLPLIVIACSRIVDGITGGNNSVANAYVSDITKPAERTQVFGKLGAIVGLGIIIGPAIGSMTSVSRIGYVGTAIAAFTISLITLVWMWTSLKESLHIRNRSKRGIRFTSRLNVLSNVWKQRKHPLLFFILIVRGVFSVIFTAYTSIVALFLIDRLGLTQVTLGPFLLFIGTFLIINQGFIVPAVSRAIGDKKMLAYGLACMSIGMYLITTTQNIYLYLVFQYVLNLGVSLSLPSFKGLLSNLVSPAKQGEIMGLDESLMAGGSAIAPLISGYLYSLYAYKSFYIYSVIGVVLLMFFARNVRGLVVEVKE